MLTVMHAFVSVSSRALVRIPQHAEKVVSSEQDDDLEESTFLYESIILCISYQASDCSRELVWYKFVHNV